MRRRVVGTVAGEPGPAAQRGIDGETNLLDRGLGQIAGHRLGEIVDADGEAMGDGPRDIGGFVEAQPQERHRGHAARDARVDQRVPAGLLEHVFEGGARQVSEGPLLRDHVQRQDGGLPPTGVHELQLVDQVGRAVTAQHVRAAVHAHRERHGERRRRPREAIDAARGDRFWRRRVGRRARAPAEDDGRRRFLPGLRPQPLRERSSRGSRCPRRHRRPA